MSIFRTLGQEVESNDINKLPGFTELSQGARASVQEAYNAAFTARQHLGMKLAQGAAYATAKAVMEQILSEATCKNCGRPMKEVRNGNVTHKFCPVCNPKGMGYGDSKRRMAKEDDSGSIQRQTVIKKDAEEEQPNPTKVGSWGKSPAYPPGSEPGAPKLTAWEKKSPRFAPQYKMNESLIFESETDGIKTHHDVLTKHGFKYSHSKPYETGASSEIRHYYEHPTKGKIEVHHIQSQSFSAPAKQWFHTKGTGNWSNAGNGTTAKKLDAHLSDIKENQTPAYPPGSEPGAPLDAETGSAAILKKNHKDKGEPAGESTTEEKVFENSVADALRTAKKQGYNLNGEPKQGALGTTYKMAHPSGHSLQVHSDHNGVNWWHTHRNGSKKAGDDPNTLTAHLNDVDESEIMEKYHRILREK